MNNIPAVTALERWLEERALSPHRFALDNGLDPSSISKILRGKLIPQTKLAFHIEQATEGAVTMSMWVPQ